jgi:hypothetical protein
MGRIVDIDLDAVDQRDPLGVGFDTLRCELGLPPG